MCAVSALLGQNTKAYLNVFFIEQTFYYLKSSVLLLFYLNLHEEG